MKNNQNAKATQVREPIYTLPLIGEPAPPFRAETTKGYINFPSDYKGKWVLLFSYPGDFCATCTTELIALTENAELYEDLGVEIVGLSRDSIFSHVSWLESINRLDLPGVENIKVEIPLVSDPDLSIAKKYGLVKRGEAEGESARGGFLIDPEGRVRAFEIYPREVGRSGEEIRRLTQAVMRTNMENVYTPAGWKPGDTVLLPKPTSLEDALDAMKKDDPDADIFCPDWFLCFKKNNFKPIAEDSTKSKPISRPASKPIGKSIRRPRPFF